MWYLVCRWRTRCCAFTQTTADVSPLCCAWVQIFPRCWQIWCVKIHNVWACVCCAVSYGQWSVAVVCDVAFKTWTEGGLWILRRQVLLPRGDWCHRWNSHPNFTPTWQVLSTRLLFQQDKAFYHELSDNSCQWSQVFFSSCGPSRQRPWCPSVSCIRFVVRKRWKSWQSVFISRLPFGRRCCISHQELLVEAFPRVWKSNTESKDI